MKPFTFTKLSIAYALKHNLEVTKASKHKDLISFTYLVCYRDL